MRLVLHGPLGLVDRTVLFRSIPVPGLVLVLFVIVTRFSPFLLLGYHKGTSGSTAPITILPSVKIRAAAQVVGAKFT